jgi:hypothetical protein
MLACAADPGDPLKTSAQYTGSSSGVGSSSGSGSSSSGATGSSSSGGTSSGSSSGSGGSNSGSGGGSSGGSSGSSSSSSSGGADAADVVDAGPIAPEGGASCVTAGCPLKVQLETPNPDPKTLNVYLNIVNTGASAVNLANVRIHYYFKTNANPSPLVFVCDYAGYYMSPMTGFDKSGGTGTFVPIGQNATPYADTFLELTFTSASLPANVTLSVQIRVHDQAFNPSFNLASYWSSAFTTVSPMPYVDADYVTAYLNGTLAWGIEPGQLPPEAGPSGDGPAGDADASSAADGGSGG